jgi:serine/threonine-protein kinase
VNAAGDVFVTDCDVPDGRDSRVLRLPAGSSTPVELPFSGLKCPKGVTVDAAGDVYVIDVGGNAGRVFKLPAGSNTQVQLSFAGLKTPLGIAVDSAGSVYVTDNTNNRVLKLPAK